MNSSRICTGESPRSSGLILSDIILPQQMMYRGRHRPQETACRATRATHEKTHHSARTINKKTLYLQSLNCLCVCKQTHFCLLTHKQKVLSTAVLSARPPLLPFSLEPSSPKLCLCTLSSLLTQTTGRKQCCSAAPSLSPQLSISLSHTFIKCLPHTHTLILIP